VSGGTWLAVVVAALAASAVAGVLFTLPVWTGRRGPRLVALLLTVQGGGALVVGAVVASAAVRSWQLVDDPSRRVTPTLMTVSRADGDGSMFALILLGVVALAVLSAIVLFLSARFSTGEVPTERTFACIVLGLEVGLSGYGLAAALAGTRSAAAIVAVVNLPLAMAAMVACLPPRSLELP
jgi:hypothetical protein